MEIKEIDTELTKQLEFLKRKIAFMEFQEICEFKISDANQIPFQELKYNGIYLFQIKNNYKFQTFSEWVEDFQKKWEIKFEFTPNIVKKRVRKHEVLKEWIPLYIGKSKNVGSRVKEHIYNKMDKRTFAMKLAARENMYSEIFKINTLKFQVNNYDSILPIVESELREIINPIVGRQ